MLINIIAAVDDNLGIGKNNSMPWHSSDDLKFFSKTTIGDGNNAILMGRLTWEAIGKKPLPKRFNAILSSSKVIHDKYTETAAFYNNIDSAIQACSEKNISELWIIGGATIYDAFMNTSLSNIVDKCLLTQIEGTYDCDTYFPAHPDWAVEETITYGKHNLNVITLKHISKCFHSHTFRQLKTYK